MKKVLQKPVVVFVFSRNHGPKSPRFGGFVSRLQDSGQLSNVEPRVVALEDLIIGVDINQNAQIITTSGEAPFSDAALVYFKSWESMPEIASALASYLGALGIPVLDELVHGQGFSKLSQLMRMWSKGVLVTPFMFSMSDIEQNKVSATLGDGPYIVKDAFGEKGKKNFFAKNAAEACELQRSGDMMLVQPYIPNDGDWRIMAYGHKVRGGIYRKGIPGSHLNNTSAGASSKYVPASKIPVAVRRLAIQAARSAGLSVAGVDVIEDSKTGAIYILEANQGSQIVTGHHTKEKMNAFGDFIEDQLHGRYKSGPTKKLELIGRHVRVDMPILGLDGMMAKVDTGAYRSALHATDIEEQTDEKSKILKFFVEYKDATGNIAKKQIITKDYGKAFVRNSSGKSEERYRINVVAVIAGREYDMQVTLTNRGGMKFPLLLGRRLLRSNFIVNPELSRKAYEESK